MSDEYRTSKSNRTYMTYHASLITDYSFKLATEDSVQPTLLQL
jgi:hypothetical protein